MPKFQVTLNDSRKISGTPGTSVLASYWTAPTVVTIEAAYPRMTDAGDLIFRGTERTVQSTDGCKRAYVGPDIECFARGTWTRWRISE